MPTSLAVFIHSSHRCTRASSASSSRRSAPVAATSAMAMAMEVSSVHSPGSQPKLPPPTIATSSSGSAGRAELVGGTQGITGCGAQQSADSPVKLCSCQCHEIASPFTHWHGGPVEAVGS